MSSARSEQIRRELVAQIPSWYVPWVHLVGPSLVGLPLVAFALSRIASPRPAELLAVPAVLALSNAAEWALHKDVLHRRLWFATFAFDRHTPQHHGAFDGSGLAIRSAKELKLVLLPAFGVIGMFASAIPPGLALAALVSRNVGALWIATTTLYMLSYEWFHLAYHLPEESWIGRLALVRTLRRHHALHHTPDLMQRWNFNVTFPLWDWIAGTLWRGPAPSRRGGDPAAEPAPRN